MSRFLVGFRRHFTTSRALFNNKIFVGSLPWKTDSFTLRQTFEKFGPITEANVIVDRATGRSRGFGFITFADADAAEKALVEGNGMEIDGRPINVAQVSHAAPNGPVLKTGKRR